MTKEERVLGSFEAFRDALFASDVEVLDRILAEDYRGYNLRGDLEGREVVLGAYAPGAVSLEQFDVRELRVEVFGEVGIITGKGYVAGSFAGDGWEHHLRFCDIYVERGEEWILHLSHATPMEQAVE